MIAEAQIPNSVLPRTRRGRLAMSSEEVHSPTGGDGAGRKKIGHYRIDSSLGRGGMGEVLLAWDERLERHVAIKRIRADRSLDDLDRVRFRREARAVARLNHPSIVQIFDVLDPGDGECIVMEYVEGHSLARQLDDGPLELSLALRLASEIADGLREAHAKGLVHRDLKSSNVIVTPAGHAKILDFGLARFLSGEDVPTAAVETVTESGVLVGTVYAMSPEQASGRPVDHRSDLFALGGLIYEMLAGEAPFRGSNLLDSLWRVTSEPPKPLTELAPQAPAELAALVERLLAKDPDQRPQNAGAVASELERLQAGLSGAVTELPPLTSTDPALVATLADSATESQPQAAIRVLVLTGLVDGARLPESLGDSRAAEVASRHDRMARDLLARFDGLEIDKRDGIFGLFERPVDAVAFSLAYHRELAALSTELEVELSARIGIHLGEVFLRRNSSRDIARGAKPLEVDGMAKPVAARVAALAGSRQTLLTHGVFDLVRRASATGPLADSGLRWLAHGTYVSAGSAGVSPASAAAEDDPLEIYEVGLEGFAPLSAPDDSTAAKRMLALGDELILGWRPAPGQPIPRRPHWMLEERVGEGGFGEVWLARHKAGEERIFKFCFEAARLRGLKREVTLFRLLKEALGHRDDIARVLDWNFDEPPYFLEAEYTEAGSLVQWTEDQGGIAKVPIATRLELVAQVAEALAAAHSVGILHKDVKPANVLIQSGRQGQPRAQLTDFGIGLLTDREKLQSEGVTVMGFTESMESGEGTSSGTLRYMAPELMAGRPATVQADIYSLGVMLYQLAISDFSRPVAPGWRRNVGDDLLADDIARFVDGSPQRRPASALEVAECLRTLETRRTHREKDRRQHFALERVRRRRRILSAVGTAASVLLILVSVFAFQLWRARDREHQAREDSERRRQQAERLIDFMLGDLRAKLEPIGRLAILEDVGEKALEYFASVPETDLSTDELLSHSKALHQIGDVRYHQGDFPAAAQAFRQSLDLARALSDRDPANTDWQFALGQSHFWVGFLLHEQRDLKGALDQFREYLDIAQALVTKDPKRQEWQLELAYAHSNVASMLQLLGDLPKALSAFETSAQILQRMIDDDPESSDLLVELAIVNSKVGRVLREQGHLQEALTTYRDNLDLRRRLLAAEPDDSFRVLDLSRSHHRLGDLLRMLGEPDQALESHRSGFELVEGLLERDPVNTVWRRDLAIGHEKIGRALQSLVDLESARDHFETGLSILTELTEGEESPGDLRFYLGVNRTSLASVAIAQNRLQPALRQARLAMSTLEDLGTAAVGPGLRYESSRCLWLLGRIQEALGDRTAATGFWKNGIAILEPVARASHDVLLLDPWVRCLVSLKQAEAARPFIHRLRMVGYRDPELLGFLESSSFLYEDLPGESSAELLPAD